MDLRWHDCCIMSGVSHNQMATQVSAAQLTTTSTSPLSPFLHYLFYVSMLHVGVLGMAQYASILGPLPFFPACQPHTAVPRVPYQSPYVRDSRIPSGFHRPYAPAHLHR